ncbi:MAG TPA: FAD-dependent oxidoreductase [Bacteroidales bacterium]|nr:FAD-dependent oxidoreductase [Bacteroidales bacterium]
MKKTIIIIGAGIAGMEAATFLGSMEHNVILLEKDQEPGGHLKNWQKLFPTLRYGKEILSFLQEGIKIAKVDLKCNAIINNITKNNNTFIVNYSHQQQEINIEADAILVTTGYDTFDATKKEEYGYGIYDNVITSADLEKIFTTGKPIITAKGDPPKKIGFVHCVGSRDEKVGHVYCSKVCCVTGVKQAIEIKELLPQCDVFCFYMDMRMYGMHFEAMYKKAQEEYGVTFIRGRVSEACENIDGSILIKVEDTLAARPLKMSVDLLVLLIGFVPSEGSKMVGNMLGLQTGVNGFYKTADQHALTNISNVPGVFFAGACTSPKTITNTITDARAAASTIARYLENNPIFQRKLT